MERLTTRIENYVFVSDEHKAIERLAVYEDTGLTPEQILAMDEEYTKLAKELGEYKRLEEQSRLIKLPIAIGETVYKLSHIFECEYDYECKEEEPFKCECNAFCEHESKVYRVIPRPFDISMLSEFGKTIFLTKAEAEKALEEMEK